MKQKLSDRAVVLQLTPLRESDLILRVLTAHHGKLSALAKGARRSKRRFMGGIDLFDCANFSFEPLKRDDSLLLLCELTERKSWLRLRTNFAALALSSVCLEVTGHLAPENDADGSLFFQPLCDTLDSIEDTASPASCIASAAYFLLRALNLSGVHPLASDIHLRPDVRAWLDETLTAERPAEPARPNLPYLSLEALLDYAQNLFGFPLQSRRMLSLSCHGSPNTSLD